MNNLLWMMRIPSWPESLTGFSLHAFSGPSSLWTTVILLLATSKKQHRERKRSPHHGAPTRYARQGRAKQESQGNRRDHSWGPEPPQPSRFYLWLAKILTFGGRKRVKRTGSEKVKLWIVQNTFSQLMKLKVEGPGY